MCKRILPAAAFVKSKSKTDGLHTTCKECHNAKSREWSVANKEKRRAIADRWQRENSARHNATTIAWRKANNQRVLAGRKKWRDRFPEVSRQYWRNRYARNLAAAGRATPEQVQARIAVFGGMCWMCKVKPYEEIDHVIPLSKGGTNWPSNLRPACRTCNRWKWDRVIHETIPPYR